MIIAFCGGISIFAQSVPDYSEFKSKMYNIRVANENFKIAASQVDVVDYDNLGTLQSSYDAVISSVNALSSAELNTHKATYLSDSEEQSRYGGSGGGVQCVIEALEEHADCVYLYATGMPSYLVAQQLERCNKKLVKELQACANNGN